MGPWRQARLTAVLAMVTALAACATLGGEPEPDFATLVVENDSPVIVNVFAFRGGTRFRVGTVPGLDTREFGIKSHMLASGSQLQIMIDPVGSSDNHFGNPVRVIEGDIVEIQVSNIIW